MTIKNIIDLKLTVSKWHMKNSEFFFLLNFFLFEINLPQVLLCMRKKINLRKNECEESPEMDDWSAFFGDAGLEKLFLRFFVDFLIEFCQMDAIWPFEN